MLRPLRLASDAELVERARGGADDAVGELLRRHRAALVRHCTGIAGADAAEDAVQHAFLRAVIAIRAPEGAPREIRPWLFRVAGNAAIDALRARARHRGPAGDEVLGAAASAGEVLERRHVLRDLVRDVRRLPERQREALVLRAIEGRSYEEIATELGASEGTVRQLIFRARERMRAATAALVAPGWLLRGWGQVGAGAGGGAVKAASIAATAGVVLGGGAVAQHVAASGGGTATAAAPRSVAVAPAPVVEHATLAAATHHAPTRRHRRARRVRRHVAHRTHARAVVPQHAVTHPAAPAPAPAAAPVAPRPAAAQPEPAPRPAPAPVPAPAAKTPTGPTSTATTPAAPAGAPAAPAPDPQPAGPAAPPAAGEITSYTQTAGFGGPLTIRRANGESVSSYFGERAQLDCYLVRPDGTVASHDTCTKERLVAGTTVALAEHAVNAFGNDVWTHVELIVPA